MKNAALLSLLAVGAAAGLVALGTKTEPSAAPPNPNPPPLGGLPGGATGIPAGGEPLPLPPGIGNPGTITLPDQGILAGKDLAAELSTAIAVLLDPRVRAPAEMFEQWASIAGGPDGTQNSAIVGRLKGKAFVERESERRRGPATSPAPGSTVPGSSPIGPVVRPFPIPNA